MCGVAAAVGFAGAGDALSRRLSMMARSQTHRGPDHAGTHLDLEVGVGLASARLRIVDHTAAGAQPMVSADGRLVLSFNGEIYNHRALRDELRDYPFRGSSDTEVFLAAFARWGVRCLDRMIGMFAFALWDTTQRALLCGRDRFGVKPLYYWHDAASGRMLVSSEIKALLASGVRCQPDVQTWRQYLAFGRSDHSDATFVRDVRSVPAGTVLTWCDGQLASHRWFDLPADVLARYPDTRSDDDVAAEYLALLEDSVRLRLQSVGPVGITMSSGLDSALLLALAERVGGADANYRLYTFGSDDPRYDEAALLAPRLAGSRHTWVVRRLAADDVPSRMFGMMRCQDEPFGGVPTLAYGGLFECARTDGVRVILDGQGMDEQWGGYDYYDSSPQFGKATPSPVQGSTKPFALAAHLRPSFFDVSLHAPADLPAWNTEPIVARRLSDVLHTKLPRALRFSDRVSMAHSCELREPFLDHRLMLLALSQPQRRLIDRGERKVLLRRLSIPFVPHAVRAAPKRPVQTPQREWLTGPLLPWVRDVVGESGLVEQWCEPSALDEAILALQSGRTDQSVAIWQLLSLATWELTHAVA